MSCSCGDTALIMYVSHAKGTEGGVGGYRFSLGGGGVLVKSEI